MAAAIPEAGAAVGGAAASRIGGDLGGDRGSPAAFMLAIVLLGLALMGFWVAFHGPDELNPDQFPGLFNAFLRWVQSSETGGPLAGTDPFGTGNPAAPQGFTGNVNAAAAGIGAGATGSIETWLLHVPPALQPYISKIASPVANAIKKALGGVL